MEFNKTDRGPSAEVHYARIVILSTIFTELHPFQFLQLKACPEHISESIQGN